MKTFEQHLVDVAEEYAFKSVDDMLRNRNTKTIMTFTELAACKYAADVALSVAKQPAAIPEPFKTAREAVFEFFNWTGDTEEFESLLWEVFKGCLTNDGIDHCGDSNSKTLFLYQHLTVLIDSFRPLAISLHSDRAQQV